MSKLIELTKSKKVIIYPGQEWAIETKNFGTVRIRVGKHIQYLHITINWNNDNEYSRWIEIDNQYDLEEAVMVEDIDYFMKLITKVQV